MVQVGDLNHHRLVKVSVAEINQAPIPILQQLCADLNAIVVLKGAHSMIGLPDGSIFINLTGNSGMGSAGSGDVLTGTIAAMGGLGLDVEEAVRQGVLMHGLAGDLAAEKFGEDGIVARDIMASLPEALKKSREESFGHWLERRYGPVVV